MAPLVESVIFVIVALVGGYFWQLEGVLLGGIVSRIIIIQGWKPYFLFKQALHVPFHVYVRGFVNLLFCVSIGCIIFFMLHSAIVGTCLSLTSWMDLIIYAACVGGSISVIQLVVLYIGSKGMRDFVARFVSKITCRK